MDEHALRVLEFDKVLARLAGLTSFSGGHDLALALRPAAAYPEALERQETLAEAMHLQEMRTPLSLAGAVDVRLALEKAALDGQLDGQELLAVAATQRTAQRGAQCADSPRGFLAASRRLGWAIDGRSARHRRDRWGARPAG